MGEMMECILTIDIGGTFTKIACISRAGKLEGKKEIETPGSCKSFLQWVQNQFKTYSKKYSIIGIGVSSPGSVSSTGDVLGYSSVPFVHEQNVKQLLEEYFKLPVFMENDANCAALAEMWNGAAATIDTYACVICGTGIGGAIVINKKLYKGANLHGGEFGYILLDREFSASSTWSELGSSSAITRRLKKADPYFEKWSGPLVFEQAKAGHPEARKSLDTFFQTLAVGVFNIQYMLDPEKILIGGGITRQPGFLNELSKKLNEVLASKPFAEIRPSLSLCHYLDQAQLYGAAVGWKECYEKGDTVCLRD
ncbi:ROK family protein [Sutcliffiella sp. FSL R7-0096]|uniref:ROK family protein n=2 Tax=unclassified Sutcliffiella TaxID=2837532 RepID=UPI00315B16C8